VSADEVVFMDPPAPKTGKPSPGRPADPELAAVLDVLRSQPRRWARIRSGASGNKGPTFARRLKNGTIHGTVAGEFEATTRRRDGLVDVFARYIGDAS
jgi:hypothetical protein